MKRLAVAFLALALPVSPLAAEAQPPGKVYRIGYLRVLGPCSRWPTGTLRTCEAERIKTDLNALFEVLERSRQAREQRISALIR